MSDASPTTYALETLPDLDWVFQENCFSSIIRYSWPSWAVEAPHRYAVGRRRGRLRFPGHRPHGRVRLRILAVSVDDFDERGRQAGEVGQGLMDDHGLGRGTVGGEAVKLAAGEYTVRVLTTPQPADLKVTVKPGEQREVKLKKEGGSWILE